MDIRETTFITIDTDWASEEVLQYTVELLQSESVSATIMITHDFSMLRKLVCNPLFDLGIHPNFNKLLDSSDKSGLDYSTIINELKMLLPEAKCVRSHSLVSGTKILDAFEECGFTHDVNIYIPAYNKIRLMPFCINNLIRVPFFWEDDAYCKEVVIKYDNSWDVEYFLNYDGIKVFNFHPIHIFLNSRGLDNYEISRTYHKDFSKLKEYRNQDKLGTECFLLELIAKVKSKGMKFGFIKEVHP